MFKLKLRDEVFRTLGHSINVQIQIQNSNSNVQYIFSFNQLSATNPIVGHFRSLTSGSNDTIHMHTPPNTNAFLIQCEWTDLSNKFHNAPVPYPTMLHFVAEMCTYVHISVTKSCIVGYLCDAVCDLWEWCINDHHSIHPPTNGINNQHNHGIDYSIRTQRCNLELNQAAVEPFQSDLIWPLKKGHVYFLLFRASF